MRGPQGVPGSAGPIGPQGPEGDTVLSQEEFDKICQSSCSIWRDAADETHADTARRKCGDHLHSQMYKQLMFS